MRNLFFLMVIFLIYFSCSNPNSKLEDQKSKDIVDQAEIQTAKLVNPTGEMGDYDIKSAKVEYLNTGMIEGNHTLYIDDYGDVVVLDINWKSMGMPEKKTIVWMDDQTSIYDHISKTVYTTPIRVKDTEPPAISFTGASSLQAVGYEKQEDEVIAGKTCSVYKHSSLDVQYWLWKKLDLKLHNNALNTGNGLHKEAISIEEGVEIPKSLLQKPEGYSGD